MNSIGLPCFSGMVDYGGHLADVLHDRISGGISQLTAGEETSDISIGDCFDFPEIPLDFTLGDFAEADFLPDDSDSEISLFLDSYNTEAAGAELHKRKCGVEPLHDCEHWKKAKGMQAHDFDGVFYPPSSPAIPTFSDGSAKTGCQSFAHSLDGTQSDDDTTLFPSEQYGGQNSRSISPCADSVSDFELEKTTEYHFQKIQEHAKLAIEALRQGNFGHNKSIVTWAHELKNKTAHELKKETELAWDTNKDKTSVPRPLLRKHFPGTTKRVEQFRKNMRRWMIGTHVHGIGVEWMVYARMEHLIAISEFLLGDALPADPASPFAVPESIAKYLGKELSAEFIDAELAEPEPGKRYSIGQSLIPHLQARAERKVPTLAFSMPADGKEAALAQWLADLRALFPKKPAPKSKGFVKA